MLEQVHKHIISELQQNAKTDIISLLSSYSVRYNLFIMIVVCTGVISIIVPFIMR